MKLRDCTFYRPHGSTVLTQGTGLRLPVNTMFVCMYVYIYMSMWLDYAICAMRTREPTLAHRCWHHAAVQTLHCAKKRSAGIVFRTWDVALRGRRCGWAVKALDLGLNHGLGSPPPQPPAPLSLVSGWWVQYPVLWLRPKTEVPCASFCLFVCLF